mmetsp:Transcript_56748/g.146063  ORF Transcript_56748/g.146063 Transcript_56748/m.146063 type:complete len:205 (-) Transcript_56748:719-1333(-)
MHNGKPFSRSTLRLRKGWERLIRLHLGHRGPQPPNKSSGTSPCEGGESQGESGALHRGVRLVADHAHLGLTVQEASARWALPLAIGPPAPIAGSLPQLRRKLGHCRDRGVELAAGLLSHHDELRGHEYGGHLAHHHVRRGELASVRVVGPGGDAARGRALVGARRRRRRQWHRRRRGLRHVQRPRQAHLHLLVLNHHLDRHPGR